jgi:DNA-binding PadR family transcriptional regulator
MAYTAGPMTEAMFYALLALMNPAHGYKLMHEISEVSRGRLNMGPGTLYGVLGRMQKDGLICFETDTGRRKVYRITSDGIAALKGEYTRLQSCVRDGKHLGEDNNG